MRKYLKTLIGLTFFSASGFYVYYYHLSDCSPPDTLRKQKFQKVIMLPSR